MKFIKPIDLWADGVQDKIKSGQLKLQCGQWVRRGSRGFYSRYVSHTTHSINVVHPQPKMDQVFMMRVTSIKLGKAKTLVGELSRELETMMYSRELGK